MDKAEAKKEYKQARRPMGIYRIRNTRDGKSYVGFATDLQARLNRHRTELRFGTHRNRELLADWKALGETCFAFEILDELAHEEDPRTDPMEELRLLNLMWIDKLEQAGDSVVGL